MDRCQSSTWNPSLNSNPKSFGGSASKKFHSLGDMPGYYEPASAPYADGYFEGRLENCEFEPTPNNFQFEAPWQHCNKTGQNFKARNQQSKRKKRSGEKTRQQGKKMLLLELSKSSSSDSNKELCNTDCSPAGQSALPVSFQGLSKESIRVRIIAERERKFQRSLEALLEKRPELYPFFEDQSIGKEEKRRVLCKLGQINWYDGTKDKRGKLLHVFGLRITKAVQKGHEIESNLRIQ
jgi:hypothetical protein